MVYKYYDGEKKWVTVSNDEELATMFVRHKEKDNFHVRLQVDVLSRHLDLGWRVQHLGENQVDIMASLARIVQLVHGDVVARQVWATAVGSPLKWSLMTTILGLMESMDYTHSHLPSLLASSVPCIALSHLESWCKLRRYIQTP